MTGTNCDLFTHNQSRSYLNNLVTVPKSSPLVMAGKDDLELWDVHVKCTGKRQSRTAEMKWSSSSRFRPQKITCCLTRNV
jgi:hypothetical protein